MASIFDSIRNIFSSPLNPNQFTGPQGGMGVGWSGAAAPGTVMGSRVVSSSGRPVQSAASSGKLFGVPIRKATQTPPPSTRPPGGGQVPVPQAPQVSQAPQTQGPQVDNSEAFEQAQDFQGASDEQLNALIAGPLQSLSEQEALAQEHSQTGLVEAQQGYGNVKSQAETQRGLGQQSYTRQRGEAQGVTETAVAQARRQAAEVQQGLQARFGSTTGTGMFSGEIAGRQFAQNVASYQNALQATMSKIGESESQLNATTSQQLVENEQQLELNKRRIKEELMRGLSEINSKRGELESLKAGRRLDMLQNYQSYVQGINQRNTEFKQSLALQRQKAADSLNEIKQKAQASYQLAIRKSQLKSPVNQNFSAVNIDPITGQTQNLGSFAKGTRIFTKNLLGGLDEVSGGATDVNINNTTDEDELDLKLGL